MSKTTRRTAASLAGAALILSTLGATAAPAAAATDVTSVTPTLGLNAGAYSYWCNMWGYFCKKAKRVQNWGSFESICSDVYCTKFYYSKKHPKPYQIKKISAVRYY